MTQVPVGLPPHLLPRSKAAPISSSTTSLNAVSTSTTPQLSRASSRNRQELPATAAVNLPADVSDKATATLIRRVLCPQAHVGPSDSRPIDELLPPLTSSNDVDLQLYAIISIVVKEFVYSWYGKITPDQGFVEEVARIFAHCTRALEQRTRKLDVAGLILDEIPQLVEEHIDAFRTSHQSVYPSSLSITTDPRLVYHTLVPHPAFSPAPDVKVLRTTDEQSQNEGAYRQLLVQGALAVLLPTEDLGNSCLRTIVADVVGEMILGNGIGNKACEGWLIWEGITKIAEAVNARNKPKVTREEMESDSRSRLEKFGLLSDKSKNSKQDMNRGRTSGLSDLIWRVLQYGYLTFLALRFVAIGLFAAYSRPLQGAVPASTYSRDEDSASTNSATALSWKRPILSFEIFSLISILLDLSDRTPWLVGALCLSQHHLVRRPLSLGATGGLFDNFLRDLLANHVFTPTRLPPLLKTIRTSIFPNNALAPARIIPSPAEQVAIKRRCAEAILDLIPAGVTKRFFARPVASRRGFPSDKTAQDDCGRLGGTEFAQRERMLAEVEEVLDTFSDAYMNKHLIFGIVELCIVRLMPEIGEMSVRELMETRLGEGWEEKECDNFQSSPMSWTDPPDY